MAGCIGGREMVRTYKCPGCGAALEYDPLDERLHCSYCFGSYAPEEIGRRSTYVAAVPTEADWEQMDDTRSRATIQMNIAVCSSCGGELAMKQEEVSSFCPYCGNATVVMDRVEERLAPDFVIPFKVSQDEAERIIRGRLQSGFYVPKAIKNFELEKLRGIYIPFWLYDMYYGADQKWKYTVSSGKSSTTYYAHVLGDCTFRDLTVDASWAFNDNSSQRLEPYDMRALKPFDATYLSGFYADRFDVGYQAADGIALRRSEGMYNESVKQYIQKPKAKLEESQTKRKILCRHYALLPVWFLTFRHDNDPYTVLLNGQTKKMVAAVPVDKKKVIATFLLFAAAFCIAFGIIGGFLMEGIMSSSSHRHGSSNNDGGGKLLAYWVIGTIALWTIAIKHFMALKKSIALSRSYTNNRLAKERQDRV